MSDRKPFPFVATFCSVLACIQFTYRTDGWEIRLPGLSGGIVVVVLVALIVLYRLSKRVASLPGADATRITHRYDILFPIAVVSVAIKVSWIGPYITDMYREQSPQWELRWSDPRLDLFFLLCVLALIFALRIGDVVRSLESLAPEPVEAVPSQPSAERFYS